MAPDITPDEIRDEERRARRVRRIADFTCLVISQHRMVRSEAEALVGVARASILELFPGRESTYELLYAPRFRRIVDECCVKDSDPRGVVVPFPRRFSP
jgi:hypothetical protein